jgi:long-chain acyl-CoA synthetase
MADTSTTALLRERVADGPSARLVAIPDSLGSWFDLTAQEFEDRVRALAKGLLHAGLHSGDRLGVLSSNRFEATLVDFAAGMIGVAVVPLRHRAPQSEILRILDDAGVAAMIVETAGDFARFDELHSELPGVFDVWQIGLGALDKLADVGRSVSDADLDARAATVEASTAAALLYFPGDDGHDIDGTDGPDSDDPGTDDPRSADSGSRRAAPGHVVLTHGVLAGRARSLVAALGDAVGPTRSMVQILPATDPSARILALTAVLSGTRLGHLHDSADLIATLRSFRPTLLAASPETFAVIDDAARDRSEATGRGTAFRQAHDVALEYAAALARGPVPMGLRTRFAVADTLILRGLRKSVGGQVRHALSIDDSATLPPRLRLLMLALDVRPLEAFGRPDTGGIVTVERPDDPFERTPGTVGSPLPGIEAEITVTEEVRLRGDGIVPGGAGADADGWLDTGLTGSLDGGRLVLDDRDLDEVVPTGPAEQAEPERTGSDVAADF